MNFTRLPNILMDKIIIEKKLTGNEFMLLCAILRKTDGYQKSSDGISLSQFQAMTGISKPTIIKSLSSLIEHGIVACKKQYKKDGGKTYSDYCISDNLVDLINKETPTPLVKKFNHPSKETLHTKETNTKETNTKEKIYKKDFEQLWEYYKSKAIHTAIGNKPKASLSYAQLQKVDPECNHRIKAYLDRCNDTDTYTKSLVALLNDIRADTQSYSTTYAPDKPKQTIEQRNAQAIYDVAKERICQI